MSIVRKYKLFKYGILQDDRHNGMFDYIDRGLDNLDGILYGSEKTIVFMNKNKRCVFEYIPFFEDVRIRDIFLDVLLFDYGCCGDEVLDLLKFVINKKHKVVVDTIGTYQAPYIAHIERDYKLGHRKFDYVNR